MARRHSLQGLNPVTTPSDRLEEVRTKLREFVEERDWAQFHDPKNLAMCLASEVGELLAEYRWISSSEADHAGATQPSRSRIANELGDVGIAWLLLCDRLNLDPVQVIEEKLERNRAKYPMETSRGKAEQP